MARFDNNDRKPGWTEFAVQPDAKRRRLDPHSLQAIRAALKRGADRRWLSADLDLANHDAFAVDNANVRFLKTDVQSYKICHRSSPVWQRPPKSLHRAPDSATRPLSPCTAFSKPPPGRQGGRSRSRPG